MLIDGSYKSLLQGVSQQVVLTRLEGQLEAQTNMLSDAVTGLRRRLGFQYINTFTDITPNTVFSYYLEVEDTGYNVIINPMDGKVRVYNATMTSLLKTVTDSYFITSNPLDLRQVSVAGYNWIANVSKAPTDGAAAAGRNPDWDGWATCLVGAFSKSFNITISSPGFNKTYSYTTPSGSGAGDAALAVPEYIITKLYDAMLLDAAFTAKFDAYKEGAYLFVTRSAKDTATGKTIVSSSSGKSYMMTSQAMLVALTSDLPANLPAQGSGAITSVGTNELSKSYFRWDDTQGAWVECGKFGSIGTYTNMPRRLVVLNGVITLEAPAFEGRIAGNDDNNPYPAFTVFGITGIGAYQGRLVLLAGGYVNMSASNRPTRFMRATTTDLRDDEAIEISAGALSAASFQHATSYNRDLMLTSNAHQAVIPATQTGLTAKNAMVVPTGTESINASVEPRVMGATLVYATDVSQDFFGVGEYMPSQYANGQYVPQALTAHIPRYVGGRCRKIVSSPNNGIGFYLSDTAYTTMLCNEYVWVGEERIQNAWHKWTAPLHILSMHYARGLIVLITKNANSVYLATVDMRVASYQQAATVVPPYLDNYSTITVTNNSFTVPTHLRITSKVNEIAACQSAGPMINEPIQIVDINTTTWTGTTARSYPNGPLNIGFKYRSSFAPTPAVVREGGETNKPLLQWKSNILKYVGYVRNTGQFDITVTDTGEVGITNTTANTALQWSSRELGLSVDKRVDFGEIIVPVRQFSEDSYVEFATDNTREMNFTGLDYTLRYNKKRNRS